MTVVKIWWLLNWCWWHASCLILLEIVFFCIQLCLEWCFAHLCQIWCKYLTFAEIECCWFSKWQPFNAHFYVVVLLESGTMRRRAKFCRNILNAGRQIEFKMAAICSVGVLLYVMIFWSLCQILFKYHCWIVARGIGIIQDVSNFFYFKRFMSIWFMGLQISDTTIFSSPLTCFVALKSYSSLSTTILWLGKKLGYTVLQWNDYECYFKLIVSDSFSTYFSAAPAAGFHIPTRHTCSILFWLCTVSQRPLRRRYAMSNECGGVSPSSLEHAKQCQHECVQYEKQKCVYTCVCVSIEGS